MKIAIDIRRVWELVSRKEGESEYTHEDNSLEKDWTILDGKLWLNPPYTGIVPWVSKAMGSTFPGKISRRIFFLAPALLSNRWFHRYVIGQGTIIALMLIRLTHRSSVLHWMKWPGAVGAAPAVVRN